MKKERNKQKPDFLTVLTAGLPEVQLPEWGAAPAVSVQILPLTLGLDLDLFSEVFPQSLMLEGTSISKMPTALADTHTSRLWEET